MRKKLLITVFFALLLIRSNAQFQLSWGTTATERGQSLQLTRDTNYIAAGSSSNAYLGKTDATLTLFNRNGSQLWTKAYGGAETDVFNSVREISPVSSANLKYVAAGRTRSFSTSDDAYLVVTDPNGNPFFSKTFGGAGTDRFNCIQPITHPVDGPGYIMVGESNSYHYYGTAYDIYVVRTDLFGNLKDATVLGGPGDQFGYWIEETQDKRGYIIAGSNGQPCTPATTPNQDIFAVSLDANLNIVWNRIIGSSTSALNDVATCVKQDNEGNLVFTGATASFGVGSTDAFLLKLDQLGNFLWLRTYGYTRADEGRTLLVEKSALGVNYVVTGSSSSFTPGGDQDALLFKTDNNGNFLWAAEYGGTNTEVTTEITYNDTWFTGTAGYAIIGSENSFGAGGVDLYLLETDFNGKSVSECERRIDLKQDRFEPCITKSAQNVHVKDFIYIPNEYKAAKFRAARCTTVVTAADFRTADTEAASAVVVSPNPANNEVVITAAEAGKIRISDLQGKLVKEAEITEGSLSLSVADLPAGLYIVTLLKKDGSAATTKLVKN